MSEAARTLLEQGAAKLKDGLLEDAVDSFTACLAVSPRNVQALQGRATARFHLKQWREAEADYTAARALDAEDPDIWSGLALSLAMQNKVYPAVELFESLLAKYPENIQGYIQLGLLQLKLVAVAKGKEYLQKALTLRPIPAQRQLIETALKEQKELDKKRFYRPDFERLNPKKPGVPGPGWVDRILSFLKPNKERHEPRP